MGQCGSRKRGGVEERAEGSVTDKMRCLAVAKEHRSRFYIFRRCLVMLLCWPKYGKY